MIECILHDYYNRITYAKKEIHVLNSVNDQCAISQISPSYFLARHLGYTQFPWPLKLLLDFHRIAVIARSAIMRCRTTDAPCSHLHSFSAYDCYMQSYCVSKARQNFLPERISHVFMTEFARNALHVNAIVYDLHTGIFCAIQMFAARFITLVILWRKVEINKVLFCIIL